MNLSSVLHALGRLCLMFGGLLLLPLIVAGLDGELGGKAAQAFIVSAGVSVTVGLGLVLAFEFSRESFDFEEGFAVVCFSWLAFSALGGLPYVLSNAIPSVIDAIFEASSGLTTTGASILPDPAAIGRPLLFWRALTHWIGGMGIVALSIAILPALGAGGNFLFSAESSGPTKEKLLPRISDVAKLLWGVYVGLTVAGIVALVAAGMGSFDAICHSFATVATGGFGTRSDSMNSYSPAIQWIMSGYMLLAGMNFVLLLGALRGDVAGLLRSAELRLWLAVLSIAVVLCTIVLYADRGAPDGFESLLRGVVFSVVSTSSTTGFATVDFATWPAALHVVLLLLMVGGACSGSTSGSAKMARHIIWSKGAWRELRRLLRPSAVFVVKLDGRAVPDAIVARSVSFLLFYIGTTCLGTLLLTLLGVGGLESLSGMITCLSGVGPGLGQVGPTCNFSQLPDAGKCILIGAMLLGRLEFYAILVLFLPMAWRR